MVATFFHVLLQRPTIPIDNIKFLTFMKNVLKDYSCACINDANNGEDIIPFLHKDREISKKKQYLCRIAPALTSI